MGHAIGVGRTKGLHARCRPRPGPSRNSQSHRIIWIQAWPLCAVGRFWWIAALEPASPDQQRISRRGSTRCRPLVFEDFGDVDGSEGPVAAGARRATKTPRVHDRRHVVDSERAARGWSPESRVAVVTICEFMPNVRQRIDVGDAVCRQWITSSAKRSLPLRHAGVIATRRESLVAGAGRPDDAESRPRGWAQRARSPCHRRTRRTSRICRHE